jgi:16S rRNA (guanine1207-N2)-methyltransferase
MRGHPDVPDGLDLLATRLAERRDAPPPARRLDATGWFGVPARAAGGGQVLERSAAALDALRRDADAVWVAPRADLGTRAVHADLAAAARALAPAGVAWAVLDRDRGAKRYARDAGRWFGAVARDAKRGRAELVRMAAPHPEAAAEALAASVEGPHPHDGPWAAIDGAPGAAALPGTYGSAALDPGTAQLLAVLRAEAAPWRGLRVLDLGCGWGPLAREAAAGGAEVVATDDDLAAVRSARRNAPTADVRHADLAADLAADARFDAVLVNPPFHVGAGVRTAVGRAFVRTAVARLAPGGTAWVVANAALPYEAEVAAVDVDLEVCPADAFKVLVARRRSAP